MKLRYVFPALLILFLISCNNEPSLQKYFVAHAEDKNFISLDLSPEILNVDKSNLTATQTKALQSFDKMNILAFKTNATNKAAFETERAKVNLILKDKKYQQLMKFGSGKEGASVSFVGTDEHIDEFILYGNKKENGFVVVRVLGKDMNPTHIMTMMSVLQQSNIDMEQLKHLQQLMK